MWCHLEEEPRLAWCLRPKGVQVGGEEEAVWVIRPESNCHHPLLPSEDAGGEEAVSSSRVSVSSP